MTENGVPLPQVGSDSPPTPHRRVLAYCQDGVAGTVERVIISPRSGSLTHVVIKKAYAIQAYVVLPVSKILDPSSSPLRLQLSVAELEQQPTFSRGIDGWLKPSRAQPQPRFIPGTATVLIATIKQRLSAALLTTDSRIEVAVADGIATLYGAVRTAAAKFEAQRLILAISGIWLVENFLVSDEELLIYLHRHLRATPTLLQAVAYLHADLGTITLGAAPGTSQTDLAALEKNIACFSGVQMVKRGKERD